MPTTCGEGREIAMVTGTGKRKTAVRPRTRGRSKKKPVGSNRHPSTFAHSNDELVPGIGNLSWLEAFRERFRVHRCRGHNGCLDDCGDEDALEAVSDLTGLTPQALRGHMVGAHE